MNISHVLHHALKQAMISEDAQSLELKVGQTVRGVLMQMLNKQEGIVQIGGIPIQALVKNPGQIGQLQSFLVDAESNTGQLVLRSSSNTSSDFRISELLKQLGQSDTAENRQLIRMLQREGVFLDRALFQTLKQVLNARPESASADQWTQAAIVAAHKNLPMRTDVVSALHQVLYGASLDKLVATLHSLIGGTEKAPSSALQLLGRLDSLLQRAHSLHSPTSYSAELNNNASMNRSSGTVIQNGTTTQRSVDHGMSAGSVDRGMSSSTSAFNQMVKTTQSDVQAVSQNDGRTGMNSKNVEKQGETAVSVQGANAVPSSGQHASSQVASHPVQGNWISSLFRTMGLDLEHSLSQRVQMPDQASHPVQTNQTTATLTPMVDVSEPISTDMNRQSMDNVKTVLLQLQAMDELPAAAREVVQQALQQVTGQQLLMSMDKAATFVQMTMFLPGFGERPAAIHLQSKKKGKQGSIDAENCRLIFDLHLQSLGDMLINVHVVDRLVSIELHNNHPTLGMWLSSSKDYIYEALASIGYRCSKLSCVPFPQESGKSSSQSTESDDTSNINLEFAPKSYKGVDLRI